MGSDHEPCGVTGGLTLVAAGLPHQHFFTCQEEIIMEARQAKRPALSKPKQPSKCFISKCFFPLLKTRMEREWTGREREQGHSFGGQGGGERGGK